MTKRAPSPVKETGGLKDLLRWPVRPFARTWLTSPTVAVLALGLGLTFAGLSDAAWSMWLDMWLTGAGLALVGFVIVKEGLLWRWMDRRLRAEEREHAAKALADERSRTAQELTKRLAQALAEERARSDRALTESLAAEREHAAKALADDRARAAKALAEERDRAGQELTKTLAEALAEERARAEQELAKTLAQALAEERARSDRALTESLAAEREHAAKALADDRARAAKALAEERDRAGQELTKTLAAERARADRALTESLATERRRARRELTKALAAERRAAGRASTEAPGQPAITVGVACYNAAPYLEQCIGSLLKQTFGDFEIVAVDDGSTDDTAAILDEFARTSDRLRVFHQGNEGPGPARNLILEAARGEYITFVDADDWLAPHCLEAVHDRAVRDDLDILCFGWVLVDHDGGGKIARRSDYKKLRFDRPDEMRRHAFAGRIKAIGCASLVRAALFHDHGLRYPACWHEDMSVTPFLYFYAQRHGYLDDELYFWRKRPESITHRAVGKDHIDGMIGAFHEWKTRLLSEGRFDDFRASFVAGVFAYMSYLLGRIEDSDVDPAPLVAYLRNEAAAFPELRKYRQYLPPEEIQDYAKVIETLVDNGQAASAVSAPSRRRGRAAAEKDVRSPPPALSGD